MPIYHHREKLLNAIVYFANHTKSCGKTKLYKLLYYLDFTHFKETGIEGTRGTRDSGQGLGVRLVYWRAQRRVAHTNGWKSRHGKSRSHVAWMAGGAGNGAS